MANAKLSDFMASFASVLLLLTKKIKKELNRGDLIQVIIDADGMKNPVSTKLIKMENFDIANVLILLEDYIQSGEIISLDSNIILEFVTVKRQNKNFQIKAGTNQYKIINLKKSVLDKHSVIEIRNNDNMCMARCLAVEFSRIKLYPYLNFHQIKRSYQVTQGIFAEKICDLADVPKNVLCGFEEAEKFEIRFQVKIKILDGESFFEIIYRGSEKVVNPKNVIFLLRSSRGVSNGEEIYHYDLITDILRFKGKKFFCSNCDVFYEHIYEHRCSDISDWCFTCWQRDCQDDEIFSDYSCDICHRIIRSSVCEISHSNTNISMCKIWRCQYCFKTETRRKKRNVSYQTNFDIEKKHECLRVCPVCKHIIPSNENHKCFMQKENFKTPVSKVVFFGF